MTAYQPLLFPEEVWEAWIAGDEVAERVAKQCRRHQPDGAPPGWAPKASVIRGVSYGVGIAGVLPSEIS